MTLRHYTRHRKPTGPEARVTIAEVRTSPTKSPAAGGDDPVKTVAANFAQPDVVESVLRAASPIGPGIQLRCPGFLSNSRQHRMFGLASLELAQLVRKHWDSVKAGSTGAMVPDAGSSAWQPRDKVPAGGGAGEHPVGYRDLFDVAVRWRQLSEPNDPVWWIDRLTPGAFREGFGLQTPMVNGQLKVIPTDAVLDWHHCCCTVHTRVVSMHLSGEHVRSSSLDRTLNRICRNDGGRDNNVVNTNSLSLNFWECAGA